MEPSRICLPLLPLATDFRRGLDMVRDFGVGGIELDGRHGIDLLNLTDTGIRQIRKWLEDAGLRVAAVAFPTRGGYADEDRLEARVAATKRALAQAWRLGAAVVLGRLGEIPSSDTPAWQLLIDVLTDIGRASQQAGASFCVEASQATPEELLEVQAAVPAGSLQFNLVTGGLLVHGHDPAAAAATLAADLGFVHATDAMPGAFAGHGRAVPLGTGQVDLPAVLATLEERGYRGWVGLEATTTGRSEAATELAAAVARLSSAAGR
jgi:L-ribulose-5-phosphate 3-epimerase